MTILEKIKINLNGIDKTETGFTGTLVRAYADVSEKLHTFEIDIQLDRNSYEPKMNI